MGLTEKESAHAVTKVTSRQSYHPDVDHVEGEIPLERNFSFLAAFGLGFGLLNSWTAMSASLSVVLPSGGSVAMVWGLLVSAVGTLAMAVSLAEICHVLPLTGGQYDWTYVLAPEGKKKSLSFIVGWMAAAGWVSLTATNSLLSANFVTGLISLWRPNFTVTAWQTLLLYLCFLLCAYLLNTFAVRILPHIDHFAGFWSIAGIIIVGITVLACSSGEFNAPKEVFATFTNETGWPNGVAFILGLLQSTFGLTAFDAVTHIIEEMPRPSINAPKVMVIAVLLGSFTAWIFMIIILFGIRDFDAVLSAATGPILQIYYQVTNNKAGATCLLMFNLCAMAFAAEIVMTVSSRIILAFARDHGLGQLSPKLAPVHPVLKVPVYCIIFVACWDVVFGLIMLGSTVALNAILGSAVVFLQISYFIPITLILIRGEDAFEGHNIDATWSLGRFRRPINIVALIFLSVTSVFFVFPPAIPVTGSSMNYVVVAMGIAFLLCGITWIIDGRKRFEGPGELMVRLSISKNA